MRLTATLPFILASFNLAIAQTDEEAIRTTLFDHYFELLGDQKISEALDYVHPDLINLLGKDMFVSQYKQMFNAPGVDISMDNFSVDTVSATHVHKEVKYALVDYGFKMTFVVDMSKDEDGILHGILLSSYGRQFGEDNVTSPEEGTYDIQVKREMFAVNDSKFEGWKIIDFEEGMRMFLKGIIPEEVFKHFNR
jgi:hypothetical protein